MSLSSDPALEIIVPGNNSELMRLRREYAATAELLGIEIKDSIDATGQTFPELSMPDLDQILDYLYKEMRRIMGDRDAINLIMGISGDLDSSAQLALLSEVIKRYDLPYKIHAYYLKKDHHNSRFRRITQLINHINSQRESGIVQLHVYEGLYTYELMLQSLVSENSGFVKPNGEVAKQALRLIIAAARDAMEKTGVVGSEAEKRHRKSSGIEKPIDEITKLASLLTSKSTRNQLVNFFRSIGRDNAIVTSGQILNFILELLGDDERLRQSIEEAIDKREQSNLIHEMLVAIRGNLCRRFDYPLTVSAQQLSELTTEDYTTSDTFVSWFPLSKIPKTVLAHVFQEYILGSNGGVSLEEWKKFPMKYLVPYYPDFMHVKERNGQKIISRDAWFFPEFNYVKVEHDASGIPVDVWDEIEQVERKNYIKIDGRIQWYLDPYLHYFLINGLSKDTVDYLIQRYPARKTDIHLTAFLLAGAREKRQKDAYMLKTANFR
ncbi:hypothetical protein A2153_05040 [Candidatus Gottesmanbacteria bacterium RBG_16_38_7b]|uniref:Uncharacterized protein n=1 Tax=Candidatus Gottesmanbacteria bacterium RBG_16_38_7b TaxID=1798372 RepID=A0A1F5YH82_9BACT|nr:MAG: hypothetical protein A2153_05040 [Candidatus Gottesmanbacteria bacterium RBG_16_38_7b]